MSSKTGVGSTFYERAAKLGHSVEALKAGMTVSTTLTANNVDQLRDVFQMFEEPYTQRLAEQLFAGIPLTDMINDPSAEGTLRRVNEFLYNRDYTLGEADRIRIAGVFPLEVMATSTENPTPDSPQIINSPGQPQVFNFGTLTLNQGIYYSVYSTIVTFTIDNVIRNGNNGNPGFGDFNIYGITGAAGTTGGVGNQGGAGTNGNSGTCKGGGGISGNSGGNGGKGDPGATGGQGGPGGDGLPSYQATISITTSLTGTNPNLYFYTQTGAGGAGGQGGTGGKGGRGGNGGKGATCGCENTNGGAAGNGGTGGTGGQGGNGGNGMNAAANIVVNIPSSIQANVFKTSINAPYGTYGSGGAGGAGGDAGTRGGYGGASGCPKGSNGSDGSAGGGGSQGGHGNNGVLTGTSATININAI